MASSSDTANAVRGFVPPQNDDERRLMRRVEELCRVAVSRGIPRYTGFLSDREQSLAQAACNKAGCHCIRFWGGFDAAERRVLCIEPPDAWQEEPLAYLQCTAYGDKLPTHRDYLGAILGLGLERSCVGDLLADPEREDTFYAVILADKQEFINAELTGAGHCTVHTACIDALPARLAESRERTLQEATVPSLRADAVLAAMLHTSRIYRRGPCGDQPPAVEGRPRDRLRRGYFYSARRGALQAGGHRRQKPQRSSVHILLPILSAGSPAALRAGNNGAVRPAYRRKAVMISSEDVRHVTFDKAFQGYRREDVDDYLKQVAQAMDDLAAQNDDLQKKLVMLAQRIEKYRTMENSLSTSMINAQRMGDSIIRESKQKAAEIIRSANIKAEDREQRARDDVELAKQEIVTLKGEADSFKRSLIEMYRKHINLINKLPDYTRRPEDEPVPPPSPAPEQAAAPAAEPQPAVQAPAYAAPAAQPVPEPAPVQQTAQMPAMQETAYYEPPTAQPVPEPTESARAQGEKVDTVEFAIAPHPEEPEEAEPAPIPVEEPAIDETRLQDVSGLYDEPEAKPARRRKAGTTRRTTRKKTSDEPQEELNSPAFDNFEGVDFDS